MFSLSSIEVTNKAVRAVCTGAHIPPFIEIVLHETINIVEATKEPGHEMAQIKFREIRRRERGDEVIER